MNYASHWYEETICQRQLEGEGIPVGSQLGSAVSGGVVLLFGPWRCSLLLPLLASWGIKKLNVWT